MQPVLVLVGGVRARARALAVLRDEQPVVAPGLRHRRGLLDEHLVAQVLRAQLRSACQPVALGQDDDAQLGQQRRDVELGVLDRQVQEGAVGLPPAQAVDRVGEVEGADLDADLGAARAEARDERREDAARAGPSVPMTTERPWPRASPRAFSSAASAKESSFSASGSSASPAGVSSTRRVERTNNGPPISRSSWRT